MFTKSLNHRYSTTSRKQRIKFALPKALQIISVTSGDRELFCSVLKGHVLLHMTVRESLADNTPQINILTKGFFSASYVCRL